MTDDRLRELAAEAEHRDRLRRMAGEIRPTPGIERMDRRIAERHFDGRASKLSKEIQELPLAEQLRLAADAIEAGPDAWWMVPSILDFVKAQLACEVGSDDDTP